MKEQAYDVDLTTLLLAGSGHILDLTLLTALTVHATLNSDIFSYFPLLSMFYNTIHAILSLKTLLNATPIAHGLK